VVLKDDDVPDIGRNKGRRDLRRYDAAFKPVRFPILGKGRGDAVQKVSGGVIEGSVPVQAIEKSWENSMICEISTFL
jgi:tryptophan synthase alpha subunit